jgi:SAM-dependent methyltransferase
MAIFGGRKNSMIEKTAEEWKQDSQSFDSVAELYDEYRPEYPPELVKTVISLSRLPASGHILEIGCGTGKATRLFALRGYSIHCLEPGAHLAALAARNLKESPRVSFEITRFEEWREQPAAFDLVMSAQAFHWVSTEVGYPKAAHALKPGGFLALFWNMHAGLHGQIAADLDEIYRRITPGLDSPQAAIEDVIRERSDAITHSGCFGPVTVYRFPWSRTYQTREYIGLLNTYSDHLRLPASTRQRLFEEVAGVIDAHGGSIERAYIAALHFAQKPD